MKPQGSYLNKLGSKYSPAPVISERKKIKLSVCVTVCVCVCGNEIPMLDILRVYII